MCGGSREACVDSSSVITELTPELELVVTVEGRLFTAEDTGVEQVGGCKKLREITMKTSYPYNIIHNGISFFQLEPRDS